jgi:hypothetical protein
VQEVAREPEMDLGQLCTGWLGSAERICRDVEECYRREDPGDFVVPEDAMNILERHKRFRCAAGWEYDYFEELEGGELEKMVENFVQKKRANDGAFIKHVVKIPHNKMAFLLNTYPPTI